MLRDFGGSYESFVEPWLGVNQSLSGYHMSDSWSQDLVWTGRCSPLLIYYESVLLLSNNFWKCLILQLLKRVVHKSYMGSCDSYAGAFAFLSVHFASFQFLMLLVKSLLKGFAFSFSKI